MDWSDGGAAGVERGKVKTASSNRVDGIFISAILNARTNPSRVFGRSSNRPGRMKPFWMSVWMVPPASRPQDCRARLER